jgi:hypothetical protein
VIKNGSTYVCGKAMPSKLIHATYSSRLEMNWVKLESNVIFLHLHLNLFILAMKENDILPSIRRSFLSSRAIQYHNFTMLG